MKKCDYCGRENEDAQSACSGCGTPLEEVSLSLDQRASIPLAVGFDWDGIRAKAAGLVTPVRNMSRRTKIAASAALIAIALLTFAIWLAGRTPAPLAISCCLGPLETESSTTLPGHRLWVTNNSGFGLRLDSCRIVHERADGQRLKLAVWHGWRQRNEHFLKTKRSADDLGNSFVGYEMCQALRPNSVAFTWLDAPGGHVLSRGPDGARTWRAAPYGIRYTRARLVLNYSRDAGRFQTAASKALSKVPWKRWSPRVDSWLRQHGWLDGRLHGGRWVSPWMPISDAPGQTY